MNKKIDWIYIIFVIVSICICLSIARTVHADAIDWLLGGVKEVKIELPQETVKTLDSEIDRLSIKYDVASSTVRAIINCESSMYGTAVNHNRLSDGTIWSSDYGPFQINDYYHKETMKKLGLDIYNWNDSLEYGFILFKSQGSNPWKASKGCWSKNN